MNTPSDLKYTKGHTWVKVDGDEATVGITDYAQDKLGPVIYAETTAVGDSVTQNEPCGVVESDKATSDVICPVSGEVIAQNEEPINQPELLNDDPYNSGWLLKVRLSDPSELDNLMNATDFEKYIAE